ncbi:MAG: dihydropteroate synthase [Armatimonadetes bacterium]|nr:dihydropteroate synthase [Armatimonadota bacterium]
MDLESRAGLAELVPGGDRRTLVMGVLNITPDSFSDGGQFIEARAALAHARRMVSEGADIIDVGGESTRPGAEPVSAEEEIRRVVPIIRGIREFSDVAISIDTYKEPVARAALAAGARIVNDISGLTLDPRLAVAVAQSDAWLVLMHILGSPRTMQQEIRYDNVVGDISAFLRRQMAAAVAAGVPRGRLIADPGIGFGKTAQHNLEILRRLREFAALGVPILVGPSRKSFIGKVLGLPSDQRIEGTAAAVAAAILNGAAIVRVHDVLPMVRVARMADAILGRWQEPPPA